MPFDAAERGSVYTIQQRPKGDRMSVLIKAGRILNATDTLALLGS